MKMAACCSRSVPAATKCCCVKAQSAKNFRHCYLGLSNSCWTIFLGSSPTSLPLFQSHIVLHNSLKQLCGPSVVAKLIYVSQLESLTLLTADVSKDTLIHVNDSIQVIFAARFSWRQHSNMTTLLFHQKTCDIVYLGYFVTKF